MAKTKSSAQPKVDAKQETPVAEQPQVNESETVVEQNTEEVDETKSSAQPKVDEVDIATVTTTVISSSATPPEEDKTLVKVLINYPDDYPAKKRFFQNGEVRNVSAASAEEFIAKGIATKVE